MKPAFVPSISVARSINARTSFITGRPALRPVTASHTNAKLRPRMTAAQATSAPSAPLIDLRGKKALVTGIANNRSIAWGIAQQLHAAGAEIGIAFLPLNEKVEKKVRNLTEPLQPTLFEPCDVSDPAQIGSLANTISDKWGGIDVFVHCLAFADKADLEGNFSQTKKAGFNTALQISAYSLIELVGALRSQFNPNASIVTLSYLGSEKVVPNYNVMGVAKAALESSVRYLAAELGPDGIRCNAVSAGPIRTLASSAIGGIMGMIKHVEASAPLRRTVTQIEVGNAAAFLLSPAASGITGQVLYVDAGYEIMGAPNL